MKRHEEEKKMMAKKVKDMKNQKIYVKNLANKLWKM